LPVARIFVPSEYWYVVLVEYQVVLHKIRSPAWIAVAVELTFARLHPFVPAFRDESAVAERFELPSVWKIANVTVVYAFPVGALVMVMIQFVPSLDG